VIETTVAGLGDVLDLDQSGDVSSAREHDRGIERRQGDARSPSLADVMASIASSAMALWRSSTPLRTIPRGRQPTTGTAHNVERLISAALTSKYGSRSSRDEHDLPVSVAATRILLGLIEPVDLVNEEHGALALFAESIVCA